MTRGVPFAAGSISLRLYPHNELGDPAVIVRELCDQAALALRGGERFDGVMTSEHHGGFAGYLAQPLQMASFILEEQSSGWVAAAPLLLPLRATALVAEEVAWLRARHPGRVGVGVALGALPSDFAAADMELDAGVVERFKAEVPKLVAMLRGEDLGTLEGDPALRACAETPVPVLSAAVSVGAARRAAACGAGILMEGMSEARRLRQLSDAFAAAGGRGSRVLIRRVWLGSPRSELVQAQRAVYESYAGSSVVEAADQTVAGRTPEELVDRLHGVLLESGADALNLRVQLPGMSPEEVRAQIDAMATEVVPLLRERLAVA